MKQTASMAIRILAAVIVIFFAGCKPEGVGRVPVAGSVTFDGKPVVLGSIAFRPSSTTSGPAAGTDIKDGAYDIPKKTGPALGSYSARITIISRDAAKANKLAGKGGDAKSFEVPVELEKGKTKYDFALPIDDPTSNERARKI